MKQNENETKNQYQISINNFSIIKKLASGGFSFVYLVQNKENDQYCVAKIINSSDENAKKLQMINHEINILKSLKHPAIINFYGYSLIDINGKNNTTIIMNYAKNGSLADAIKKAQNSLSDIHYENTERQIILAGIACGMMYLHNHQIIHHDLKPENILLDENYHPIITDFGLSKKIEYEGTINVSYPSGTPIYMAPEIISNSRYDQKVDVYSFGIIMYEVVTELAPYPKLEGNEIAEQTFVNQVVNDNYRPTFQVPVKKSIKNLIEQCWSKNSQERPTFEEIFKKLAFTYKNKENNYFLDDVDIDQFNSYIESITKDDCFLNEEKICSVENFNELCLHDQQTEIIRLIEKSQNIEMKQNLAKANDFLAYLQKLKNQSKAKKFLNIKSNKPKQNFNLDLNRINILSNTTTMLFQNKSFESAEFIKLLKEFDEVSFEIEFPTEMFNSIYETLKEIKITKRCRIKITVLIQKMNDKEDLFQNNKIIDYIVINSSLNSIPKRTFFRSESLIEIALPSSVESIGDLSFRDCTQLMNVVIPPSVTSIGCNAFEGCISIESITIPSSITMISSFCFCRCSSLTNVTIPSSVTRIGRNAFRECSSLRQISIPSSVKVIGDNSFEGCTKLIEISLPNSVISIGMHLFRRCISLIQLDVPFLTPSIRRYFFNECLSLRQITIPSSVQMIEDFAFDGCSSLEQITIPPSVVEIGSSSFSRCESLKQITIPSSVESIGNNCFWSCLQLKNVSLSSSLIKIGNFAFCGCSSLNEILIPSSVTSIGTCAFCDCGLLEKVDISAAIQIIESSTFSGCLSLKQIEIPSSVTVINECAFYGCSSLTELTVPSAVISIGNFAFDVCSSLEKIYVPSALTSIGEEAFPPETNVIKF